MTVYPPGTSDVVTNPLSGAGGLTPGSSGSDGANPVPAVGINEFVVIGEIGYPTRKPSPVIIEDAGYGSPDNSGSDAFATTMVPEMVIIFCYLFKQSTIY